MIDEFSIVFARSMGDGDIIWERKADLPLTK